MGQMAQGLIHGRGKRFFSSLKCPEQLWDPPSLLFSGYWVSLPGGKVPGPLC
jgi:hypothetical protein